MDFSSCRLTDRILASPSTIFLVIVVEQSAIMEQALACLCTEGEDKIPWSNAWQGCLESVDDSTFLHVPF